MSPSKAGELWIEFHEALCSDVADEAAGVLALDQLLQPDGKRLRDYVDEEPPLSDRPLPRPNAVGPAAASGGPKRAAPFASRRPLRRASI